MEVYYLIIGVIFITVLVLFLKLKKKKVEKIELTNEFKEILHILESTNQSVFITGKAGTGKSTLLRYFSKHTNKNHVIVAPTGVAALNVKGKTIHSFFQLPWKVVTETDVATQYKNSSIFLNLDALIIDEISMVRVDLMNAIDISLRKNRNKPNLPFGGVQLIIFGDLFQLPPIAKGQERTYLENNFGSVYFFDAPVFKKDLKIKCLELTNVFRQKDEIFVEMLGRFRINKANFEDFVTLNKRHKQNLQSNNFDGYFTLTSTRATARTINNIKLKEINSPEIIYKADLTGSLLVKYNEIVKNLEEHKIDQTELERRIETDFPTEIFLKLKKGAQVMMIRNDAGKRWVNGSIGTIYELSENKITVNIGGYNYPISKEIWEDVKYSYDNIENKIISLANGSFSQFPIKLAYAMTINKSQGQTYEKVIIDMPGGAFAHGQTYVALSRCKSLEGIALQNEINHNHFLIDPYIVNYYSSNCGKINM